MYGDIDIEKDMHFIATAESDESDEEYLRLFAHKEDADLWVMLSKLDGETPPLRLVSFRSMTDPPAWGKVSISKRNGSRDSPTFVHMALSRR